MSQLTEFLNGRTALITGAGSGVAKTVAIGLAEAGASVILVGRTASKLEETRKIISEKGGSASFIVTDVSSTAEVEMMSEKVLREFGTPSVLVNGAGVHGEVKPISVSDPERWIKTLMINTAGPYLVCRAFMNEMTKLKWGRIVNITSASSLGKPNNINSAYAVSKNALNHFTRQLAAELEGTGVTANVIHPGEVKTEMWAAIRDDVYASGTENMRRWIDWVDKTGGDPPVKTLNRIFDLISDEKGEINGRFLWIENGLKEPMETWD